MFGVLLDQQLPFFLAFILCGILEHFAVYYHASIWNREQLRPTTFPRKSVPSSLCKTNPWHCFGPFADKVGFCFRPPDQGGSCTWWGLNTGQGVAGALTETRPGEGVASVARATISRRSMRPSLDSPASAIMARSCGMGSVGRRQGHRVAGGVGPLRSGQCGGGGA